MAKEITCTVCPLSCNVVLELGESGEILSLTGNRCARGKVYATKEHENPERTLTTIVKIEGGRHPVLPVRTNQPIPKTRLKEGMLVAAKVQVKAPIAMGDVIIKDFLGLGVDLVASRDL
ncbi:MAG TPA: molybdopterin oxidoreductase [Firmicutes bacterium]|nr:molybdopterin oxidoreductase [Bacillota bacterium]